MTSKAAKKTATLILFMLNELQDRKIQAGVLYTQHGHERFRHSVSACNKQKVATEL